jgi:hypothetical protein
VRERDAAGGATCAGSLIIAASASIAGRTLSRPMTTHESATNISPSAQRSGHPECPKPLPDALIAAPRHGEYIRVNKLKRTWANATTLSHAKLAN